jgi:hypothetical protein
MKKLLILALGVVLLVSFSVPVLAETKVTFKGSYRVRYFYRSNMNLRNSSSQQRQANFFDQRFRIEPAFIVSDNLQLNMRINAINGNRWGQAASGYGYSNYDDAVGTKWDSSFDVERCWMTIRTSFGAFLVGRVTAGAAGLMALGYSGGMFANTTGFNESAPFDSEGPSHRIIYQLPIGNFQITALYQKQREMDDANNPEAPGGVTVGYDEDMDLFVVVPQFKWSTGVTNVTMVYARDRSNNRIWNPGGADPTGAVAYDLDWFFIDPALILNFGPFSMHFEAQYRWGQFRPDRFIYPNTNVNPNTKFSGWGAYWDGIYTYGPGQAGLMVGYFEGSKFDSGTYTTGSALRGQVRSGADHAPFLVAYGGGASINGYITGAAGVNGSLGNSNNHWMVGAWWDHNITEKMMVHAALGYFERLKSPSGVNKFYGWEVDLGYTWNIMDGLRYTTMVGYFVPGKWHKYGTGNSLGNAWAWKNQLQLSF